MVKGVSLQTEGNGGVGVISDVGLFGKLRWGAGGGGGALFVIRMEVFKT